MSGASRKETAGISRKRADIVEMVDIGRRQMAGRGKFKIA